VLAMAGKSDEKHDEASRWNPGQRHWWFTTTLATIGSIIAGISLVMNFFYQPDPPPTTIESSHSEFLKLSYTDRVDRCQPFIVHNLENWGQKWRSALNGTGGALLPEPIAYAPVDDANANGQAIVNTYLATANYAEKIAPTDEGENLLSCVFTPALKMGPRRTHPDIDALVGSDDDAPKVDNIAVKESHVFYQGEFAGNHASGRATKIVEVLEHPGPGEIRRQYGFVMVSGHDDPGIGMWALMASIDAGQAGWMNDIQNYRGF
jgi:hypothetical protein